MHSIFLSEEEIEEEKEIKADANEGIRNNKLHSVEETPVMHDQMGGH